MECLISFRTPILVDVGGARYFVVAVLASMPQMNTKWGGMTLRATKIFSRDQEAPQYLCSLDVLVDLEVHKDNITAIQDGLLGTESNANVSGAGS